MKRVAKAIRGQEESGKHRWLLRASLHTLSRKPGIYKRETGLISMRFLNRLRRYRYKTSITLAVFSRLTGIHSIGYNGWLWTLLGELNWKNYRRAANMVTDEASREGKECGRGRLTKFLETKHAWNQTKREIQSAGWNNRGRLGRNDWLENGIGRLKGKKVVFWHHYDSRGFLSRSWMACLEELRKNGWVVVVSSSVLEQGQIRRLEDRGFHVLVRPNLGLCLGAYKDFAMWVSECISASDMAPQLMLFMNDSTLPIVRPEVFAGLVGTWLDRVMSCDRKFLWGLTDSVQLGTYHLQTYCFAASQHLIESVEWYRFWLGLDPDQEKQALIVTGELGLTQEMLSAGVDVGCEYSLTDLLAEAPSLGIELKEHEVVDPRCVNMTLFGWKTLASIGYPLIKKQAIFEPCEGRLPKIISLAELNAYVDEEARKDLWEDIRETTRSRFSRR